MIFENIIINGINLNNRVMVSPMCQYSANNGKPSKWHYNHLSKLIKTGAGSIIVESTAVSKVGRISTKDLCLYNSSQMKAHKKLINHLKKIQNVPIILQISHSGRKGSSEIPWISSNTPLKGKKSWKTISASSIKRDEGWPVPKKANKSEIKKIISQFISTANLAFNCGYDGVEVHIAHGYLLHQFFSPISNQRKDDYGGNLKKRTRIILEIFKGLSKIKKNKKIFGARITGKDHLEGGLQEEDCVYLINKLTKFKLDYACISSGGIIPVTKLKFKKGFRVNFSSKIKSKTKVLISSTGQIYPKKYIKNILEKGKLDLVAVGRRFISNPNWLSNKFRMQGKYKIIPKQYLRCY